MAGLGGEIGGRLGQAFDQTRGVPTTQPVFDLGMSKAYLDQASAIQQNRQKRRQEDLKDAQQVMKLNQDLVQQGAPIRFVVKQDGSLGVQQISGDQANQERTSHLRRMAFDAGVPIPPGMDVSGNPLPQGQGGGGGAPVPPGAQGGQIPGGAAQGGQIPGAQVQGALPPAAPGGQQAPLPPGGAPPTALPGGQGGGIPQEFTVPQPYGLPPKVVRAGDPEYAQMAEGYVRLQQAQQGLRTGQQVQQQNEMALQAQRSQAEEAQRQKDTQEFFRFNVGGILRSVADKGGTVDLSKISAADRRAMQQGAAAANRQDPVGALVDAGLTPDEAANVMGLVDPTKAAGMKEARTRFDKALDDLQKAVTRKAGGAGMPGPMEPSKAEVDVALHGLREAVGSYNAVLPKEAQFDVDAYVDQLRRVILQKPAEDQKANDIRAKFQAGKMTREEALKQLQALGYQP